MWTDDRIVDAEDDGAIVIRHDARTLPLEDGTVDLIITSPPYFALRSYRDGCAKCSGTGTAKPHGYNRLRCVDCGYEAVRKRCNRCDGKMAAIPLDDVECSACGGTGSGHFDGQIGSEDTPDLFLAALDECMVEWGRVLKPSGSVWVNLGDKYAGSRPR